MAQDPTTQDPATRDPVTRDPATGPLTGTTLADVAARIQADGGRALVLEADITDEPAARAAVEQAVERLGRLDVLVNNAGVMLLGSVEAAPVQEWQRMVEEFGVGAIRYVVTRPRHVAINELLVRPTEQQP